jgi:phage replication initiation protein
MVDIPGEGCGRVRDWTPLIELVEQYDARVTRLDVACDFRAAGLVDAALHAYRLGAFNGRGAPPSARLVDDLGSGAGRTFYVGSRESATFCRVYEKGRQLGDAGSDWVRVELELKPRGTEIPLGAIVDAAEMFAGAYKFTRALLPVAEEKPVRIARAARIVVGRAIEVAAQQAGAVVGWLARLGGYSASTIVSMLMRDPSPRLVGGVLDPDAYRPRVLLRWIDLEVGEGSSCVA